MFNIKEATSALQGAIAFNALSKTEKQICIYSEGPAYFPHLQYVLDQILEVTDFTVSYISSSLDDPGLRYNHKKLKTFFIGLGHARNYVFSTLNVKVMLMTMPDLHCFQIKRSINDVKYVYLQHSICSLHMIYRTNAFDYFDAICCIGNHQVQEVRALEKANKLKKKKTLRTRYFRLDELIDKVTLGDQRELQYDKKKPNFLIAPSWGELGLIESGIAFDIIKTLLSLEYAVSFRPHPQTRSHFQVQKIMSNFSANHDFQAYLDVSENEGILKADYMISDWSGVAFEFALSCKRPILFCDTSRKINNEKYDQITLEPIEVKLRNQLGCVWDFESSLEEAITQLVSFNTDNLDEVMGSNLFDRSIGCIELVDYIKDQIKNEKLSKV
jgi:CDP-glycerol glycerophosphotransferase (TagB/SpsB family)